MFLNPATIQFSLFAVKEIIAVYPSLKAAYQAILDNREVTLEMWAAAMADVEKLKINLPLPVRTGSVDSESHKIESTKPLSQTLFEVPETQGLP